MLKVQKICHTNLSNNSMIDVIIKTLVICQTAMVVIKDTTIGAEGVGIDTRVGEIEHSVCRQRLATAVTFSEWRCQDAKPWRWNPSLVKVRSHYLRILKHCADLSYYDITCAECH